MAGARVGSGPSASWVSQLGSLLEVLSDSRIGGTFNQYRDSDGDDAGPEAPQRRLRNVVEYLAARGGAPVLLVAEAAGWRGARYSGLCLCCERQLDPSWRTSRHPLGWSEPSATVVQAAIAPWRDRVVLWNAVPTHPRQAGLVHSNRPPTRRELNASRPLLEQLLALLQPRWVAAIGRSAASLLGDVPQVRHPSHGGAQLCSRQLRELLEGWLGG